MHQYLMPLILDNPSPIFSAILQKSVSPPSAVDDQNEISSLIGPLQLNPKPQIPPTGLVGQVARVYDLLEGTEVDEPDQGMDQELEASVDPKNERKWMGGNHGATSQGFRHMYFGGWRIKRPLGSLQIPFHAIGQAPIRIDLLSLAARQRVQAGNRTWGTRLISWALHYVQDLTQPFHTTQIPSLPMVPWASLFQWPPQAGFQNLVQRTTQSLTNFHWAYEGYTLNRLQVGEGGPFAECLRHPETISTLKLDPQTQSPRDMTLAVIASSEKHAPEMGAAVIALFGTSLKNPEINLTQTPDLINYTEIANNPALENPRKRLEKVTCEALADASLASRFLITWAFQP